MVAEKNLQGLGGWLVLVGIGVVVAPLRLLFMVFPAFIEMFSNGYWDALTTPGTEHYHVLWGPILLGEMFINGALVLAWIYAAFLFFSKKKSFPKWFIGLAIFTLIFIVLDALAVKIVLPNEPVFDPETFKELARSLVACLLWVPYMRVSKRVQATFIK